MSFNFLKPRNIVTTVIGLSVIFMGVYVVYPQFFDSLVVIKDYFKLIMSVSAALAGIYVIYNNLGARVPTVGRLINLSIGVGLLIVGLYMQLGVVITEFASGTIKTVIELMPYGIAAISLILALNSLNSRKHYRTVVFLAIAAVFTAIAFL